MDDRSTEALFDLALTGDEEDETAWEAVRILQQRGDQRVFDGATTLLRSPAPNERGRGADILAQLGTPTPPLQHRTQCADAVLGALATEQVPSVIQSMGVALSHLQDPRAVEALLPFRSHPDARVRFGVVLALSPHESNASVEALIQLSRDADDDVRNWATFGLGTMDVDSQPLRDALMDRLSDSNSEIRGEALVGLAHRKEARVLEPLRRELERRPVGILAVDAAEALGDPSLVAPLVTLRNTCGGADDAFKSAFDRTLAVLAQVKLQTTS
jgi:HEAT repeat protein